jgi:hypothetical protein
MAIEYGGQYSSALYLLSKKLFKISVYIKNGYQIIGKG